MAHAHTPMHVSALSQQFNHVAIDSSRALPAAPTTPPKPRPSSKRKGKSDLNPTASSGSEAPQLQQQQQPRPKQRSPKANKVNGVKNFSTPSKPTAIPNGHPPPAQPVELASHYAGPTFHSSPAPSSLPMPSFLASRPTATSKSAIPVGYDPGTWSPPNQSTPVKPNRLLNGADYRDQDDSPLGPLFRADREEKNRLRSLNSAENRAMGSPTQRPASAGGIPDHLNLYRSESPVPQNGPYQRLNTQTDLKNASTSELPFQMDGDFQPLSSHNHLAQRFRAITENSTHYTRNTRSGHGTPTHVSHINEPRRLSLQSNVNPATSDLESSTQALKSLLSINSPPSHHQPSNAIPTLPPPSSSPYKGPPSPKLIQHHRTRSAVNPLRTGSSPNLNGVQPARRIFSTSRVAPDRVIRPNQESPLPASPHVDEGSDEERAIKMEKELRKVLNLS